MSRIVELLKKVGIFLAILLWFPAVMGTLGLTVLGLALLVAKAVTALAAST